MGFAEAASTFFAKYVTFSGRARRSEFWWSYLLVVLVVLGAFVLDLVLGTGFLVLLAYLGVILPLLAVGARRLHDTGRSAWFLLLAIVPFGGIALLVFWVMDSVPETNQHGPSPKQAPGYGTGFGDYGQSAQQY